MRMKKGSLTGMTSQSASPQSKLKPPYSPKWNPQKDDVEIQGETQESKGSSGKLTEETLNKP